MFLGFECVCVHFIFFELNRELVLVNSELEEISTSPSARGVRGDSTGRSGAAAGESSCVNVGSQMGSSTPFSPVAQNDHRISRQETIDRFFCRVLLSFQPPPSRVPEKPLPPGLSQVATLCASEPAEKSPSWRSSLT